MLKKTSSKIPKSLQWVLWSVDVNQLDKEGGDKNFRGLVFFIYWRDYVDLFFFLKWRFYSIKKIIALAKEKFGGEFNEKLFLGQLVYFDDIKIVPTVFLKESYTDDEIKSFLEKEVEAYIKKILPR